LDIKNNGAEKSQGMQLENIFIPVEYAVSLLLTPDVSCCCAKRTTKSLQLRTHAQITLSDILLLQVRSVAFARLLGGGGARASSVARGRRPPNYQQVRTQTCQQFCYDKEFFTSLLSRLE
jgi:hypothetical protein